MRIGSLLQLSVLVWCSLIVPPSMAEADIEPIVDWQRKQNADQRLEAFGENVLGDAIDPHTGSLRFVQTDIDLPGNSHLPVRLSRQRMSGFTYRDGTNNEFGDWTLDVPRISVLAISAAPWQGLRCSQPISTTLPTYQTGSTSLSSRQYSDGVALEVPGQASQQLLDHTNNAVFPGQAKKVTRNYWYFTCITASDGGEGFIGHAPNGDKYRFDRAYTEYAPSMGFVGGSPFSRSRYVLAATEVTDVHGNKVNYTYDSLNRLNRIYASDGRDIQLAYSGTQRLITQATAEGKTWSYQYRASTYAYEEWERGFYGNVQNQQLSKVVQPDGFAWEFVLDQMSASPAPTGREYCPKYQRTVSVKHPYGLKGTFVLHDTEHRQVFSLKTRRLEYCISAEGLSRSDNPEPQPEPEPIPEPDATLPWDENVTTSTMAVVKKTLEGPGLPASMEWLFSYERDAGASGTSSADRTNWTKVTTPEAQYTYYHAWVSEPLSGKLVKKETRSRDGVTLLRTENYTYQQETAVGYSWFMGVPGPQDLDKPVHTKLVTITQHGDQYVNDYQYGTDQASVNYSYGSPLIETSSSNISTAPRTKVTVYQHNKTKWLLGLPTTEHVNNRLLRTNQYNSNGQVSTEQRYGQLYATYEYNADGTVAWARDALSRTYYARQYRAGVPQVVERPDGSTYQQQVDGFGRISQLTDAKGFTTYFERDVGGRLQRVVPPSPWLATQHSYNFSGSPVHKIERGNSRVEITYDVMFRAATVKTTDLLTSNSTIQTFRYNSLGKETFASQPALGSATTAGTETSYDALQRLSQVRETVSPFATVNHSYLSGHRHQVTDAAGHVTTYHHDGYAGPEQGDVKQIDSPNSTTTVMTRNIWGELTQVRQYGSHNGFSVDQSRNYVYNSSGQLCRLREPDVGDTLYAYDAAGGLSRYAKGVAAGSSCVEPSGSGLVTLTPDALGRVRQRTFSDGTPQIVYDYDANNNLTGISRGGLVWSYGYNSLNLPVQETLTVDQRQYQLGYVYNTAGQLTSKTLPGGLTVGLNPDGLGRARSAGIFAQSATYHANQQWASYQLGNGIAVTQTLNTRGLPNRHRAVLGNTPVLDLTYSYDARALLTGLSDAVDTGNSRVMTYDGQERLLTSTGPWGNGNWVYDSLGNLRSQQLGSRSIGLSFDAALRVSRSLDTGGISGQSGTSTGDRYFGYDNRGNVTTAGAQGFVYDASDRVTNLTGAVQGSYSYDGHLRRVRSDVAGARRYHVYNLAGDLVHVDDVSQNQRTDYVKMGKQTIARVTNGVATYLHHDLLGSPAAGTNPQGQVLWRERYTPYGETLQNPAANANQASFTGHVRDAETGLVYMQARYYDPVIGKFYSNDPVDTLGHMKKGNPTMGFNRYAYANNNPYKYTDPDGEFLQFVGMIIGGFVAYQDVKNDSSLSPESKILAVAIGAATGAITGGMASVGLAKVGIQQGMKMATRMSAKETAKAALSTTATGAAAGAVSSVATQLTTEGSVEGGKVAVAAGTGALGGAVAATGPAVLGNTALGQAVGMVAEAAVMVATDPDRKK